jgi:hypothetical protein
LLLRSEEVTDRQNQNERGFEELMKWFVHNVLRYYIIQKAELPKV